MLGLHSLKRSSKLYDVSYTIWNLTRRRKQPRVIITIRFPSLRTLSNILIFSLALMDLLVGLVVQPAFVVYIAGKLKLVFNCGALLTYLFSEIYCVGLSLITLSLIACERFFAIVYPFKYINEMTKPRLITVV